MQLRARKNARHAKPSTVGAKAAPLVAAGSLTAGLVVLDGALAGSAFADAAPTPATFDRLAQCESGGRWSINTGNGYYGGLQFSAGTWRALGFAGLPHQASRETQIAAGQKLQARSGWGQWPACARSLGLYGGSSTAPAPAPAPARASRSAAAPSSAGKAPFGGTVTTAQVGTVREDVRAWQARMRQRGWSIAVDGRFGQQSAQLAQRFAVEKRLPLAPGSLDAVVYGAAWSLPVT